MERILLVEDDPAIVRSLSQLLLQHGLQAVPASTQRDALPPGGAGDAGDLPHRQRR